MNIITVKHHPAFPGGIQFEYINFTEPNHTDILQIWASHSFKFATTHTAVLMDDSSSLDARA
jgi:hypothetical protein